MKNWNGRLDTLVGRTGWGLFFILIGTLLLAQNQGWLNGGWWEYFALGLGCIFVAGFLVRYFAGNGNCWKATGGLVIGLALIYIGIAFLYGFGDWWPMALIPIGIGYLIKAFYGSKSEVSSQTNNV
jgi:hypothetical protein